MSPDIIGWIAGLSFAVLINAVLYLMSMRMIDKSNKEWEKLRYIEFVTSISNIRTKDDAKREDDLSAFTIPVARQKKNKKKEEDLI